MTLTIQEQVDVSDFNSLNLPSIADYFVAAHTETELLDAVSFAQARDLPLVVLGGGSNVILPQRIAALVLRMCLSGIRVEESGDEVLLTAAAGENWHDLVMYCLDNGYHGIENLALIPGTVGAAPIQNIGAYGVELQQCFECLKAWDCVEKKWVELSAEDCAFAYRDSVFKQQPGRYLISSVTLRLSKTPQLCIDYAPLREALFDAVAGESEPASVTAAQLVEAVIQIRRSKLPDPALLANAGSFFKNPIVSEEHYQALKIRFPNLVAFPQNNRRYKLAAGWLLEHAGWKGKSKGRVGMHDQQALVLVNHGGATAEEVLELANTIQADVQTKFGVELVIEPQLFL